ncbi:hypothetical protein BDZ91DRAFT_789705 [Kalaharituber pfeilii]|nr:hypothetical protein BDZ91DRAFT_789705 [Kalaharituber pfeilii]
MNEHQQQPTPTPASAPEIGNEVLNAPAGAEELDSQPNIRNHATLELEILSGDQDSTRRNLRTNFSLLQPVLQAHGGHAEVVPRIFHEMPALQNPRSHHHTQSQPPFASDTTLMSAYQSMNRDIASEQGPVELRGVGSTQACGNATLLVELPPEMDSELLPSGTVPREWPAICGSRKGKFDIKRCRILSSGVNPGRNREHRSVRRTIPFRMQTRSLKGVLQSLEIDYRRIDAIRKDPKKLLKSICCLIQCIGKRLRDYAV